MSTIKKLAGDTAIYGVSSIVGRFLNFLLTPFYTKVVFDSLLPQYGVITELYSYIAFLMIFLTFGMETGYFRFMQKKENSESIFSSIIAFLFFISIIFFSLVIIFLDSISDALNYSSNKSFIIILAVIVCVDAFSALPFAKLRLQSKAKRFALLKIVNIGVNIFFNIFFFLIVPKFYNYSFIKDIFYTDYIVVYVLISNLIASIVTFLCLIPEIISEKFSFKFSLITDLLPYSFPIVLSGLAGQINEIIDRPLLKYLISVPSEIISEVEKNNYVMSQMGIYGANFKLAVIITLFIQAFRYAFEPIFFKMGKGDDQNKTYSKVMTYYVIFSLSIFLAITLYIDIFKNFIGENYWQGLSIVPIILMSQILLGISFNQSIWYKLSDKTIYGLYVTLIGAVVTLSFNFLLVPKYGYIGSAISHVVCYLFIISASYYFSLKHYKVPYNFKRIVLYFIFALLLFFVNKIITIKSDILSFGFHTILFMSFVALVIFVEKISIRSIISYGSKNR